MRAMIKQIFSSLMVLGVGLVAGFAVHLILARLLSVQEYGIYNFIFSTSLMISVFSLLGFQTSSVRLIPRFKASQILPFLRFAKRLCTFLAVVLSFIVYGILSFLGYDRIYGLSAFLLGGALVLLMTLLRLLSGFLRGFGKPAVSMATETTMRELGCLLLLGACFLAGIHIDDSVSALIILTLALSAALAFSWLYVMRLIPKGEDSVYKAQRREWIELSWPMMLTVFAQRLLRRCDVIILGLMVNPALVGAYALAANFADAGSITEKAGSAIFSPKASKLYHAGDTKKLFENYIRTTILILFPTLAGCMLIALLAPYVYPYFGQGYESGYNALLILLAGVIISFCFGPVQDLMAMTEYEKPAMYITAVTAIANVILNPVFIILYGIEGAAVTTAFLGVARRVAGLIFLTRKEI